MCRSLNSKSIKCINLKVGAKGRQYITMTGELLSPTAQDHITESSVESQTVQALYELAGMFVLHKHIVGGWIGINWIHFSHVSLHYISLFERNE